MPDTKLADLNAGTAEATDIVYAVKDPSGTPVDRKIALSSIKDLIVGSGSVSVSSGKTLASSNTLTLAGTDGTTMTFPASSATIVGTTTTQTLTNKTLTDPVMIGTILEDIFAITDGAAFEIDPGNGSIQTITLGASRTPKATNFAAGESVILMVDDGSAFTLTWTDATFGTGGVSWKTNGGSAPTLNTSGFTVITLWKVGTQIYGARVGDA